MTEKTCTACGATQSADNKSCVFCATSLFGPLSPSAEPATGPSSDPTPVQTGQPQPGETQLSAVQVPQAGATPAASYVSPPYDPKPRLIPRRPSWWKRQERGTKALVTGLSACALALLALALVFALLPCDGQDNDDATATTIADKDDDTDAFAGFPGVTGSAAAASETSGATFQTGVSTDGTDVDDVEGQPTGTTLAIDGQTADRLVIGSTAWTVTSLDITESLEAQDDWTEPRIMTSEQGKYVVIYLEVGNEGLEPISFFEDALTLVDAKGRRFASAGYSLYSYIPEEYEYFYELNPGFSSETVVIYEVPKDTEGFVLLAKDLVDYYEHEEQVAIDLGE